MTTADNKWVVRVTVGLALTILLALLASVRIPTGESNGTVLQLPAGLAAADVIDENPETLRVDNFNVRRGKGKDGVRDLMRAAEVLQGTDIAGIQELSGSLFYGLRTQAVQLAAATNTRYLYAPPTYRWFQPDLGSALLSKYPVESWRVEVLPRADTEEDGNPRNILYATIRFQGQAVNLMVTHLDRSESRQLQLDYVLQKLKESPGPSILMADLNTDLSNDSIKAVMADPEISNAIELAIGPFWRLDWIFTKGFNVVGGGVTPRGISDHAHYWVELTLSDQQ